MADPDRAKGSQQVIPLLPFGYATESVDSSRTSPDTLSVALPDSRHGDDNTGITGERAADGPRSVEELVARRPPASASSSCTSGATARGATAASARAASASGGPPLHGRRRPVRHRRALDDGRQGPAVRRRGGGAARARGAAPPAGQEGRAPGARLRRGDMAAAPLRAGRRGQCPQVRPGSRRCGSSCWARTPGCWWRPARWTGYGASGWPRTTSGPRTRRAGAGLNLLGFALMEARQTLREGAAPEASVGRRLPRGPPRRRPLCSPRPHGPARPA